MSQQSRSAAARYLLSVVDCVVRVLLLHVCLLSVLFVCCADLVRLEPLQSFLSALLAQNDEGLAVLIERKMLLQEHQTHTHE